MKNLMLGAAVFAVGVIAGVAGFHALLGRGPAMVYAGSLEAMADGAIKVRLGEYDRFLKDFERNAPVDAASVRRFGDYDFVRSALRKAAAYYDISGTPVPDEISTALASLPSQAPSGREGSLPEWDRAARLVKGDTAPALRLRSIEGQPLVLSGNVAVLSFFATWCGPCRVELPRLEKDIWARFAERGVVMAAIGRGHTGQELAAFRSERNFTFPMVADPTSEVYRQFASGYIPRCVLIGKDGLVKAHTAGAGLAEHAQFVKTVEDELAR